MAWLVKGFLLASAARDPGAQPKTAHGVLIELFHAGVRARAPGGMQRLTATRRCGHGDGDRGANRVCESGLQIHHWLPQQGCAAVTGGRSLLRLLCSHHCVGRILPTIRWRVMRTFTPAAHKCANRASTRDHCAPSTLARRAPFSLSPASRAPMGTVPPTVVSKSCHQAE